ncbi:MAG: hypothetical protein ABI456_04590 [Ktedonobacteraceae bacterium]
MKRSTGFVRGQQVGKWCKWAAWIIAVIGIINLVLNIYTQGLLGLGDAGGTNVRLTPYLEWSLVRITLENISSIIFEFFLLYAVGTALNYFLSNAEKEQDVVKEDLKENESVQPG